jgi:DICT domain-containing protein
LPPGAGVIRATSRLDPRDTTLCALVSGARPIRRAGTAMLGAMSRKLEEHARQAGSNAVVLNAFQRDEHFTPALRERYAQLAPQVAFCGAVAEGMATEPAPGVRGGHVHATDPLAHEWTVAVVSPMFAVALTGYDLGEDEPPDRRFEFVLTYDRGLAVGAAACLMARIPG